MNVKNAEMKEACAQEKEMMEEIRAKRASH